MGWDFEDETPGRDARGGDSFSRGPDVETHLVNTVLTNGARYYVDHAHPEYSTPECVDAREVLIADKAGERIVITSYSIHYTKLYDTTNPDDWAKISGKKGERIVYVRTLMTEGESASGGRQIERVATGQYL